MLLVIFNNMKSIYKVIFCKLLTGFNFGILCNALENVFSSILIGCLLPLTSLFCLFVLPVIWTAQIFNKSLLAKFAWAMDVDPVFRF